MAFGLKIINDNNELLIDSDYVNPTFVQKLEFNTTESAGATVGDLYIHPGYIRRYYSTNTVSIGTGSYIVLWALPESIVSGQPTKDVWYMFPTSVAENNLQFDCSVFSRIDNPATYTLPTAYIFTVDANGIEAMSSSGPALRMYNSATPRKKTFDSNFVQLAPYSITPEFTLPVGTNATVESAVSTPANPIYLLPKAAAAFSNPYYATAMDIAFRRKGQFVDSKAMETVVEFSGPFTSINTYFYAGTFSNLSVIVADANLYQASGGGTSGGNNPTYNLSSSANSVNEGGSFTITLTTANLPNGTTVGYNVTGIQQADLTSGTTTGNFTISNNTASVGFTVAADSLTEGTETFRLQITSGTFIDIYVTIVDTSLSPISYAISPQTGTINETNNKAIIFTVTTVSVADTTLYWAINGGSADPATDFVAYNGSFALTGGTGTFIVTAATDAFTEGSETFSVGVRTGSVSGTEQATTGTINITDTSLSPASTYTITPAANNVNEGSTLSISVGGTNIIAGTYYWSINNISTDAADFSATSGSFSISSNSGSFSISPSADNTTEGAQTFTVTVLSGSTSGTPLITSSSITINDTSLWPVAGTVLNSYCLNSGVSPYTFRQVIANGTGGSTNSDTNNSTSCGYIAAGTLQSSTCLNYGVSPYTLRNTYYYGPDASYGTYNVDTNNSATCGWVQTYNESLSISPSTVSVSNYTTISISGGQPSASVSYATTNYGDPQPPSFPGSASLNGSGNFSNYLTGGSITGGVVGDKTLWVYFPYNSHVRNARVTVVPDAGQAVGGPYCTGTTRYQDYTDGSGGTYASVVEYYSTTCGWTPPTATWSVSYSNSGTSGNINVSVTVSLSGVSPTQQTFYFSGYVSQNGAGFNVPSVTINAGSISGSGFAWSGFTNGTGSYSTITLIADVDTAPYTITPSSKSNSFSYSSTGVIQP
jgi:hypothetical protein